MAEQTPPQPPSESQSRCRGSEAVTEGVRVTVEAMYLPQYSTKGEGWQGKRYIFGYRIRITNESPRTLTLRSRHWTIVDADGEQREVQGEGVIGQQPTLRTGDTFIYESSCPLETPWGTMEGTYQFEDEQGQGVTVRVARFYLAS